MTKQELWLAPTSAWNALLRHHDKPRFSVWARNADEATHVFYQHEASPTRPSDAVAGTKRIDYTVEDVSIKLAVPEEHKAAMYALLNEGIAELRAQMEDELEKLVWGEPSATFTAEELGEIDRTAMDFWNNGASARQMLLDQYIRGAKPADDVRGLDGLTKRDGSPGTPVGHGTPVGRGTIGDTGKYRRAIDKANHREAVEELGAEAMRQRAKDNDADEYDVLKGTGIKPKPQSAP